MKSQFWNNRYQNHEIAYGVSPNQFLVRASSLWQRGSTVLSIGEGEGRNSLWMATKGLNVWAIDYSLVGLKKAQIKAKGLKLAIKYVCLDLLDWIWPENYFDAIVIIFVHLPPQHRKFVHKNMMGSLKPDGHIVMQAFHKNQLQYNSGGPKSIEMLYTADILRDDFIQETFLELEETEITLDEGPFHQGKASVINMIVQK